MSCFLRLCLLVALLTASACDRYSTKTQEVSARIESVRPHDPGAYTQGLLYKDGRLWESTGLYGQSTVREVDTARGEVLRRQALPDEFFGEGLAWHGDELWVLTWREQTTLVMNPVTLETIRTHRYPGEGWGLTSDGAHLIMSDGTSTLRFMRPSDFSEEKRITVTENGKLLSNLNELEFTPHGIFANVYMTERIVLIDPANGRVTASLDLSALRDQLPRPHRAEVLNGIAWDDTRHRLFVTGKLWPSVFELSLEK